MTAAFSSSPRSGSPYGTWPRQKRQKPTRQGPRTKLGTIGGGKATCCRDKRPKTGGGQGDTQRDQSPDPNVGPKPITLRSQNRLRRQTVDVQDPRSGRLPPSQQLRQARTTKIQTRRRLDPLRRPRRVSFSPLLQRPRQGHSFKSRLSTRFCQQQKQRPRHRRRLNRRSREPRQRRP